MVRAVGHPVGRGHDAAQQERRGAREEADRDAQAAEQLRLLAHDAKRLGVVDEVVPEPAGGAHRKPETAAGFSPASRRDKNRRSSFGKASDGGMVSQSKRKPNSDALPTRVRL